MFDFLFKSRKPRIPMRMKFETIIQRLSNDGRAIIFKEKEDRISWGVSNLGGKVVFEIVVQSNESIAISWLSQSPFFGTHRKQWTFPSDMDQNAIVDQIGFDLQKLLRNG